MSVVIGYVSDFFSIIMTDTRITFGKEAEMGWDDQYEKLVSIPNMGWATGVGVYELILNFNKNLANMKSTSVENIEVLFKKTLEIEENKNGYLKENFDATVITCSWVCHEEDKNKFRIGLLNKQQFGSKLVYLRHNHVTILYPYDFLDDFSKVDNIEKKIRLNSESNRNLEKLLHHLLQIFAEISANSIGVSRICDIGIQIFLGKDLYKFKLKDNVQPLIKAAKDGTLLPKLSVVY